MLAGAERESERERGRKQRERNEKEKPPKNDSRSPHRSPGRGRFGRGFDLGPGQGGAPARLDRRERGLLGLFLSGLEGGGVIEGRKRFERQKRGVGLVRLLPFFSPLEREIDCIVSLSLSSLSLSSLQLHPPHRLDPPACVHKLALELGEGRELAGVRGARGVHLRFFLLRRVFLSSSFLAEEEICSKKETFSTFFSPSRSPKKKKDEETFFHSLSSALPLGPSLLFPSMFASCARAAAARLRANAAALSGRTGAAANSSRRGFASGSGGHDDHGVTYEGVTLHKPARWHSAIGTGMASLMWCVLKGRTEY